MRYWVRDAVSPAPSHRIALCAGEASGDLLGAALMRALRQRDPNLEFVGIGGPQMRAAGLQCWFDASELAVMGLVEVLRHLPRLLRLRREFLRRLRAAEPSLYIGIDAPDFNLGIERRLKAVGMRTIHYVSPSIWAWRQGRAASIGRCADLVLCLFPFEPALYARHGVAAQFVGHPFADEMPLQPDRAAARSSLGLAHDGPVLAVLVGSRGAEIARLGADFLGAAEWFQRRHPGTLVLLPAANARLAERLQRLIEASAMAPGSVRVLDGQMRSALAACDLALVASGTATLEAALAKRPMVVAYRIAALTWWIVKLLRLLKVTHYSLPNVLAGREVVPEVSQNAVTPANLVAALDAWMLDPERQAAVIEHFARIHQSLRQDASERAADAVIGLLSE